MAGGEVTAGRQGGADVEHPQPHEVEATGLADDAAVGHQPREVLVDAAVGRLDPGDQVDLAAELPQPVVGLGRHRHQVIDGEEAVRAHLVPVVVGPVPHETVVITRGGPVHGGEAGRCVLARRRLEDPVPPAPGAGNGAGLAGGEALVGGRPLLDDGAEIDQLDRPGRVPEKRARDASDRQAGPLDGGAVPEAAVDGVLGGDEHADRLAPIGGARAGPG